MGRGKLFHCVVTVSSGVREKLSRKHDLNIWEIEEAIYDDPQSFSIKYRDCHFVYKRTASGRYLLILLRVLKPEEVKALKFTAGLGVVKIITAREMNDRQRKTYLIRKGKRR